MLPLFIGGAEAIVPEFLPPLATLRAIVEAPVSGIIVVPAMLSYILSAIERGAVIPEAVKENLKFVLTGGDRLNTALDAKCEKLLGLPILEGYGITECSPVLAVTHSAATRRLGTVGPFLDNIQWQLRTRTGELQTAGAEEGVLWVKGPSVTGSYYKDPATSAERFDEGWFNSGDYVRVQDGYLTILDRVTDIIIVGGFNVYPQEVELILNQHPAVGSAIVVGMRHTTSGEVPKAFISKKEGAKVTEQEIIRFCKEHLAHFKVPRRVEFVDEWPLSSTGKILRRILRDRDNKGSAD
jgi:long-chain acyl-CoA synthetase